eukprot:15107520-Alexandrium_andersonii.AAC.1
MQEVQGVQVQPLLQGPAGDTARAWALANCIPPADAYCEGCAPEVARGPPARHRDSRAVVRG